MNIDQLPFIANYGILHNLQRTSPVRMPHPNNRSRSNAERSGARMQGASRSAAASRRTSSAQAPESLAPSEQPFENVTASEMATTSQTSSHATASTTTMAPGLMFISSVNDLSAFKDRGIMKAARARVMHNFVGQKRLAEPQPQSEPPRSRRRTGSNGSRTASSGGTPGTQGPSTAPEESIIDRETALSIYRREPRRRQVTVSASPSDGQAQTSPPGSTGSTQSEPAVHAAQQPRNSATNSGSNSPQSVQILVPHGARESHYYRSHNHRIELTWLRDPNGFARCLGSSLDPFNVLPQPLHRRVNIYPLKRYCKISPFHTPSL